MNKYAVLGKTLKFISLLFILTFMPFPIHFPTVPGISTEIAQAHPKNECRVCSKLNDKGNSRCIQCKEAYYCSEGCQKHDWIRGHREICKNFKIFKEKHPEAGLTENESKVEFRKDQDLGIGLVARRAIKDEEIIAFYWGRYIDVNELACCNWVPTIFQNIGQPIIGERSPWALQRPYLGAQFANDGAMPFKQGQLLLSIDPIIDGQLDETKAELISKVLSNYSINVIDKAQKNELSAMLVMDEDNIPYIRANRDIHPGEKIEVAYGPRFWLNAVTNRLALRGYMFEAIEIQYRFAQHIEQQLPKEYQMYYDLILKDFGDGWMTQKVYQNLLKTKNIKRLEIVERFSGLFAPPGRQKVIFTNTPMEQYTEVAPELIKNGHLCDASFWANLAIQTPNEKELQQMNELVQKIQQKSPEEFSNIKGIQHPHPEVLEFLKVRNVYFVPTQSKESHIPRILNSTQLLKALNGWMSI